MRIHANQEFGWDENDLDRAKLRAFDLARGAAELARRVNLAFMRPSEFFSMTAANRFIHWLGSLSDPAELYERCCWLGLDRRDKPRNHRRRCSYR